MRARRFMTAACLFLVSVLLPAWIPGLSETPDHELLFTGNTSSPLYVRISSPEYQQLAAYDEQRVNSLNLLLSHLSVGIRIDGSLSETEVMMDDGLLYSVFTREDENGIQKYTFYSDNFTKEGELAINPVEYEFYQKREERALVDGKYTGAWEVKEEINAKGFSGVFNLHLNDFDQSCDDFRNIFLTQTLFNTDDKYEYLLPIISPNNGGQEEDRDRDGQVDLKFTWTDAVVTGFKVVSETGNVLQTINFENGFHTTDTYSITDVDLLRINGKLYLCFDGYIDDSDAVLLYSIDSTTNGVHMMTMEKVSSTRRYNLSGRPTNGEKGINIIRMSDGTTKKVLVK